MRIPHEEKEAFPPSQDRGSLASLRSPGQRCRSRVLEPPMMAGYPAGLVQRASGWGRCCHALPKIDTHFALNSILRSHWVSSGRKTTPGDGGNVNVGSYMVASTKTKDRILDL